MKISTLCASLLLGTVLTVAARADFIPGSYFINPALPGVTQADGWSNSALLVGSNPGFPGFPGFGAWPAPIQSNSGDDATLMKTASGTGGGPYPAGASIYFGGFSDVINNNGGQLTVSDATPVSGLANVVFQLDLAEAWTYDFWNDALPVLSFNAGGQNLAPSNVVVLNKYDNGTMETPNGTETVYINTYLLQWDLTSVAAPISNYSVAFNGVQHAQLYALQLNQSSQYRAVPEPTSLALVGLCLAGLCGVRRRQG